METLTSILRELRSPSGRRTRMRRHRRRRLGQTRKIRLPKNVYKDYNEAPVTELHNSFVGANDIGDHYFNLTITRWLEAGLNIHFQDAKLHVVKREFLQAVSKIFGHLSVFGQGSSTLALYDTQQQLHVIVSFTSLSTEIKAYGSREQVDQFVAICDANFSRVTAYIDWIYSREGHSMSIPLNTDRLPSDEMYPFLKGRTLAQYYDEFMHSSASILLLIGPPGTGKTSFIRGLLHHTGASATVTYDTNILEQDFVFAEFIEGEAEIMVLEDSDSFLQKRTEGNTMMHRFLNVGDGLVTTPGKKMIFSTNLPSIREVDPALIRPGRCFDILEFGNLSADQAQAVATKAGINLPEGDREQWSLAEIFNGKQKDTKVMKRLGFV